MCFLITFCSDKRKMISFITIKANSIFPEPLGDLKGIGLLNFFNELTAKRILVSLQNNVLNLISQIHEVHR